MAYCKEKGKIQISTRTMSAGFTLAELIVSMALFIVVILIVTSTFLTLTDLHKKARTTRTAIDNVSIVVERIVRTIRTGSYYYCTNNGNDFYNNGISDLTYLRNKSLTEGNCFPTSEQYLIFQTPDSQIAGYAKYTGQNRIRVLDGRVNSVGVMTGSSQNPLTNEADVQITKLDFYVTGAESADGPKQSRAMLVLQGYAGTDPDTRTAFSIYSSVTQRSPDE